MSLNQATSCPLCHAGIGRAHVRWRKDGFDIVACPECGLVFRSELPSAADVAAIYGEEYFRQQEDDTSGQGYLDYLADADEHRANARHRLKAINALMPPGRLLDVGAAAGFFVAEAAAAGWTARGVDVAPAMTAHARQALELDVETGLFQTLALDESFDLVTMWDYIEHSFDPVGDVRRAFDVLRPGGRLAISTGDVEAAVARLSGERWHLLTPRHHNFFFSARTMARLLRDAGFEVGDVRHPAARFSARYLVHNEGIHFVCAGKSWETIEVTPALQVFGCREFKRGRIAAEPLAGQYVEDIVRWNRLVPGQRLSERLRTVSPLCRAEPCRVPLESARGA